MQCCPALSKKSKFIKVVYIFTSEVSLYGLSENGIVCYAMVTVLEISGFEVEEFC